MRAAILRRVKCQCFNYCAPVSHLPPGQVSESGRTHPGLPRRLHPSGPSTYPVSPQESGRPGRPGICCRQQRAALRAGAPSQPVPMPTAFSYFSSYHSLLFIKLAAVRPAVLILAETALLPNGLFRLGGRKKTTFCAAAERQRAERPGISVWRGHDGLEGAFLRPDAG